MTTWAVTMQTGDNKWSTITVESNDHAEAIAIARRLIGGSFVKVV